MIDIIILMVALQGSNEDDGSQAHNIVRNEFSKKPVWYLGNEDYSQV